MEALKHFTADLPGEEELAGRWAWHGCVCFHYHGTRDSGGERLGSLPNPPLP